MGVGGAGEAQVRAERPEAELARWGGWCAAQCCGVGKCGVAWGWGGAGEVQLQGQRLRGWLARCSAFKGKSEGGAGGGPCCARARWQVPGGTRPAAAQRQLERVQLLPDFVQLGGALPPLSHRHLCGEEASKLKNGTSTLNKWDFSAQEWDFSAQ